MATTTYVVKSGDTLSAVARRAGITLTQLYNLNPKFKTDPKYKGGNLIWAGTTVKLPAASPPPPPPPARATTPPPTASAPPAPAASPPASTNSSQPRQTAAPATPPPPPPPPPPPAVKSAPIDTVLFNDETFAEQFIVDVLFEDLVGQELLTIARNDTVNGQEVSYQPIKNLDLLQSVYNPSTILALSDTSQTFFENFIIDLNEKIPSIKNGLNGKNYYVDQVNGDLVIELANLESDEQVEIQIATSGTIEELGI